MKFKLLLLMLMVASVSAFAQSDEKGWSVDVNTGYAFHARWAQEYVGVHYRFNDNFSLGFTSGVFLPEYGDPVIPFLVDARGFYPIEGTKFTAMLVARGGIYQQSDFSEMKTFGFNVQPGVRYNITDKFSVQLMAGYELVFSSATDDKGHSYPIQAGVNFKF